MSPGRTRSWNVPQVPIRTNVVAPTRASSSIAIAADGQPIPVDVHEIGTPRYAPVNVTYSRLLATSCDSSQMLATSGTRPGSPGRSTYGATSPGESLRWYWTLTRDVYHVARRRRPTLGRLVEFGADAEQAYRPVQLEPGERTAGGLGERLGIGGRFGGGDPMGVGEERGEPDLHGDPDGPASLARELAGDLAREAPDLRGDLVRVGQIPLERVLTPAAPGDPPLGTDLGRTLAARQPHEPRAGPGPEPRRKDLGVGPCELGHRTDPERVELARRLGADAPQLGCGLAVHRVAPALARQDE